MDAPNDGLDRAAVLATPVGIERRAGLHAVLAVLGLDPEPVRCGRFELLDKLGEGAMGVVYRARDPELRRELAIKILRTDARPGSTRGSLGVRVDRLREEARALARLSHPNVVKVLGTGTDDGGTWIAMELVVGTSLARLSETAPPTRERALMLLRAAAEGLAAAHAAGLVHRDFKPANVLVAEHGSVKVADFGLAEVVRAAPTDDGDGSESRSLRVGTPRYMAPEQHLGLEVDARADQFAFAVSSWETLAGDAPFAAPSLAELLDAIERGAIARRGANAIPMRLRGVLRRALAYRREDRFASMNELLRAWDRALGPQRLAIAVLGVAAVLVVPWLAGATDERCEGTDTRRAFAAIWHDARRSQLGASLRATDVAWAESAIAGVDAVLDEHARAWIDDAIVTCKSAPDDSVRDRHVVCRDRAIGLTDAWLDRLDDATPQDAERVVAAARLLPRPSDCTDAAVADDDAVLRRRLADAMAAKLAGAYAEAAIIAGEVAETAERDGRALLRCEALFERAQAEHELGTADVERWFGDAHAIAIAEDAPALAFGPAAGLARFHAQKDRPEQSRTWLRHAESAAARLPTSALRAAELDRIRCALAEAEGRFPDALEACERALADLGPDAPPSALRENLRTRIASLHHELGNYELALAMATQMRDEAEHDLGPMHPRTAGMYLNLGTSAAELGDHELAESSYLHAAEIFRVAYGEQSRWVVSALMNVGASRHAVGDLEGAERALADALAACGSRRDAATARVLHNLAEVRRRQGHSADALVLLDRVGLIEDELLPADHPQVALTHHTRGNTLMDLGRWDDAERELLVARRIREHTGTTDMRELDDSFARLRARAQP